MKRHEGTFWRRANILYFYCSGGCKGVDSFQSSSNCGLKGRVISIPLVFTGLQDWMRSRHCEQMGSGQSDSKR